MISAAARAELRPGFVIHPLRHRRYTPVLIHHFVFTALLKCAANAEPRLPFDDISESVLLSGDGIRVAIVNSQLHTAGNVHTDCVWNHRVLGRKYATDRQTVTDMCIR